MELLQLRYFYESAENESFAKTAEKYKVPPTSVSASVKRLEKELGCELFDRKHNKIFLNDSGRKFKDSIKNVFKELDEGVMAITSSTADTREINILARAMRNQIIDHIIEYKLKNPHISFKTVFDFDDNNYEKYDIIIDEKSDRYKNYESFDLFTTKIRLCASAQNHLVGKKLSLSQLKDEAFVSVSENNSLHKLFLNACKKAGFTPNVIMLSNDISCNRKYVEANVGIGLSRDYSEKPTSSKTIEYLNISDFNEKQTICAYFRKESVYGNIEHFLKFLKNKSHR